MENIIQKRKLLAQLALSMALLLAMIFLITRIVEGAALNPGHAWNTLDDAALPIANGGTAQTTANAAFNALAPSQGGNSGKFLTTDASNTSWGTAYATSTRIVLAGVSSASLTADIYCHPRGYSVCAASNASVGTYIPFNGTIRNLYGYMVTAPAADGSACAFTVQKATACTGGFSATALTCTITGDGATVTCSDTSNSASV